jgi:hypothetical protein
MSVGLSEAVWGEAEEGASRPSPPSAPSRPPSQLALALHHHPVWPADFQVAQAKMLL